MPPAGEPRLVIRRLHRDNLADHLRVIGSTILSTEQVIFARAGRLEPFRHKTSGHDILLDAKRWNEKIMDHILRRQDQLHRPADRDVQLIDFAHPAFVIDLPHPLLADDVNLQRVFRRTFHVGVDSRPPEIHHHHQNERNDRPGRLQHVMLGNSRRNLIVGSPAIANREVDNRDENQEDKKAGDAQLKEKECRINLLGGRGSLRWDERHAVHRVPSRARSSRVSFMLMYPPIIAIQTTPRA